jgi:hypothetical protein
MPVVLFLGMALMALASVVIMRGVRQFGNTGGDARWEQALAVAESGLDQGIQILAENPLYTTGEVVPIDVVSRQDERVWVVGVADERPYSNFAATPEGEYTLIKPSNSPALYVVGFTPSRSAPDRRVRVVRGEVDEELIETWWMLRFAFLSGGDAVFSGNPTLLSGTNVGVHANGYLSAGGSTFISGCISASNGAKVSGSVSQEPHCADPGDQPLEFIPVIDPRLYWYLSQYDMCPGGTVKAGPAHDVYGHTAGNLPCTGQTLASDPAVSYRGWSFDGCCDPQTGAEWSYHGDGVFDGVYYFHEGSVKITSNPGSEADPWETTLLIEPSGECPNLIGGDLDISGTPRMQPHPSANGLLALAGRDIEVSGTPGMFMSGLLAAHEQADVNGNPTVHEGGFIAEEACNSINDLIDTTIVSGNTTVSNSGPVETPIMGLVPHTVLVAWDEL